MVEEREMKALRAPGCLARVLQRETMQQVEETTARQGSTVMEKERQKKRPTYWQCHCSTC